MLEQELDPEIRSVLSNDEIADFGRRCVAHTEPADRRMMLAWMLPAVTRADVEAFLGVTGGEKARESGVRAALFFPLREVERWTARSLASLGRGREQGAFRSPAGYPGEAA